MNSQRYFNILLFLMFLSTIILLVIDISRIKSSGAECLKDAGAYYVRQLEKANIDSQILCQCTKYSFRGSTIMTFDSEGNKNILKFGENTNKTNFNKSEWNDLLIE